VAVKDRPGTVLRRSGTVPCSSFRVVFCSPEPLRPFCPHGEELRETSSLKTKKTRRPAKADKAAAAAIEQALEQIDIKMILFSCLTVSPLNVHSMVYVQ
jgi:hypothetical protein